MGDDNERIILEYNKSNASTFVAPRYYFSLSVSADLINISKKEFFNYVFLQNASLYEGIETIGKWAFCHCHDLKEITIPSSVNKVEQGAFAKCFGLEKVVFSKPSSSSGTLHLPLELGPQIFSGCKSMRTLQLRAGITVVPKQFCLGCSSLKTVTHFEATIETIGESAFEGCCRLEGICLPKTTKKIGIRAFFRCCRLKSNFFSEIEMPAPCLELIDDGAFGHCPDLRNIWVPSSVRSIGKYSFDRCENLVSVELAASTLVHPSAFSRCLKLRNIKLSGLEPTDVEVDMSLPTEGLNGSKWIIHKLRGYRPSYTYLDNDSDYVGNQLLQKVCHRWDDLPIHRLCYYQSHHPVEVTLEAMQQAQERIRNAAADDDDDDSKCIGRFQPFDEFGMSPFKILTLSTKPRYEIFAQLMRVYSVRVLLNEGRVESYVEESTQIDDMTAAQALLRAIVSLRIPHLRLKRWRMTMLGIVENYCLEWRGYLAEMLERLEHLEFLENLALLEQAVWKVKLAEDDRSIHRPRKRIKTDGSDEDRRQACRTVSGASVVIPRVLPFLEKSEVAVSRVIFRYMHQAHPRIVIR